MRTGALKPADLRFVSLLVMLCLLVGTTAAQAAGPKKKKTPPAAKAAVAGKTGQAETAAAVPIKEWGPYLDVAYELTYWDRAEIREWRQKCEQQIGKTLAVYIAEWNGKLAGPADISGTSRVDNRQPVYRERDYLRLAIAQTVDFLQSENLESLNGAELLLDKLKDKATMPEVAFWTGFVKALQAVEVNDSAQFVARVFDIWNNAVMYIEQGTAGAEQDSASGKSAPYLYRNIVNLVVNRAIIDRKMGDLNALGPLFIMMRDRDLAEKADEGQYLTTLVRRIADGFVAPDADRYRLNFTVAIIEAQRLQKIAAAKLDTEGMSGDAHRLFEQSRLFDDYALKWASSHRSSGAALAVADYLDITSFAIQRLADNEKAPAYRFFAMLPAHDGSSTLLKAMDIFNDLAAYADGGWERAGYANRELYLKAMHRLWRTIMELALWTGDFYQLKLDAATDPQAIFAVAAPMQAVLNSYLDFFAAQTSKGFPTVIPDSACFGAAEAAEKLAHAYLRTYTYSTDSAGYNLWFVRRLQAAELFPLAPREIAQTAAVLRRDGRYNLFLDYFLPLADRFKQSAAVQKWLEGQKSESAAAIRTYAGTIDKVFAASPGRDSSGTGAEQPAAASFRQLRDELQRKPDHPVHQLLRAFYVEEMLKTTPYTRLLKDANRLNREL
jgi:hypothetical protein